MIKPFIVLSALASVMGRQFDIMSNLIDYDDTPYQRISLPFRHQRYQDERLMNVRRKLLKNMGHAGHEVVITKHPSILHEVINHPATQVVQHPASLTEVITPVNLIQTGKVMTTLVDIQTSFTTAISNAMTTLFNGLSSAMKLLKHNLAAIIVGALMTIGTSIFSSIISIPSSLRAFISSITPEKLNRLARFVEDVAKNHGA